MIDLYRDVIAGMARASSGLASVSILRCGSLANCY